MKKAHSYDQSGHGRRDPGNNVYEKDLFLVTLQAIEKSLRNTGADVIMTRTEVLKYL